MRLLTISAVIGAGLAGWSCLGSRVVAVVSVTAPADTPIPLLRPLGPVLLRRFRAPRSRPLALIAETMCHGVAETELAVGWRLDSVGLVAETELAVTHWPDGATVPDVGRDVSRIAEAAEQAGLGRLGRVAGPGALRDVSRIAEAVEVAVLGRIAETARASRHLRLPVWRNTVTYARVNFRLHCVN